MVNRWSTGRFVFSAFYIGCSLFVLAKRRSKHLFTVRWRVRGAVGFQGDRNVGTLFCPASLSSAVRPAPCRPDPPVLCPVLELDSDRLTRILFASYSLFISGIRSSLLFLLPTSGKAPFFLHKPFSCKAGPENRWKRNNRLSRGLSAGQEALYVPCNRPV